MTYSINDLMKLATKLETDDTKVCIWASVKIASLQKEIDELRSGHRGACFTCEPVGELNKELQDKVASLEEELSIISYKYEHGE